MTQTVLVVDDDDTNLLVARLMLEDIGFSVIDIDNAEEAISMVMNNECDIYC